MNGQRNLIALFYCLIFCAGPFACNFNSEDENKLEYRCPRVVFDFDNTIGVQTRISQEQVQSVFEKYSDAKLFTFWWEPQFPPSFDNQKWFFIYPYFGEVFLILLRWGWHVDFFSAEMATRNNVIIPAILRVIFEPYGANLKQ